MNQIISLTESPDYVAIKHAVGEYFRGHASALASVMRNAFHESAYIEGNSRDVFTRWSVDEFCNLFKGVAAADESSRVRTIEWIDFEGDAAVAKVTLIHGQTTFTDYLALLKIGDQWKISNKIYNARQS